MTNELLAYISASQNQDNTAIGVCGVIVAISEQTAVMERQAAALERIADALSIKTANTDETIADLMFTIATR